MFSLRICCSTMKPNQFLLFLYSRKELAVAEAMKSIPKEVKDLIWLSNQNLDDISFEFFYENNLYQYFITEEFIDKQLSDVEIYKIGNKEKTKNIKHPAVVKALANE